MSISLLDQVASTPVEDYNPADIVRAVNMLRPLGKEKALKRVDSYLESRDKSEHPKGLFWVLRVLFDVTEKRGFPPVVLGTPDIPAPSNPAILPRYPIVMTQSIPFLVVRGYTLRGLPEPVEAHIAYFRTYGTLRAEVLRMPSSMKGIEEDFLQRWTKAYDGAYTLEVLRTIRTQLAKLGG